MHTVQQPVHGYRTESSAGALQILVFVHAHHSQPCFTCWHELCVFVHGAPVLGGGGYLNACSLPDSLFVQTCTHTMHGLRPTVVLRRHHSLQDSSRWMPHLRVLLSRQDHSLWIVQGVLPGGSEPTPGTSYSDHRLQPAELLVQYVGLHCGLPMHLLNMLGLAKAVIQGCGASITSACMSQVW